MLGTVQSWLCGWVLARFDPSGFALHTSRGHESPWSKLLMRWSAVAADLFSAPPLPRSWAASSSAAPTPRSMATGFLAKSLCILMRSVDVAAGLFVSKEHIGL